MSVETYIIEGIGVKTKQLRPYLNDENCIAFLKEYDATIVIDEDSFNINDYISGKPFKNLSELLYFCDYSDCLRCDGDGNGEDYLYYPPKYPWQLKENDPRSIEEAHKLLIETIQRICDISREDVEALIDDDLYEVGWS